MALSNELVDNCLSLLAAFSSLAPETSFLLASGVLVPLCIASGVEHATSGLLEVVCSQCIYICHSCFLMAAELINWKG